MNSAPFRAKGTINAGGQNHFYMETQAAVSSLVDGEVLEINCGTQDPTTYQNYLCGVLGMDASRVVVKCLRTGGGFGGKLTAGIPVAASAALASLLVKRPVRIFNTRTADMNMHSGREGYSFDYEVGYDSSGQILSVIYDIYCEAGYSYTDAINSLNMAMMWADNAFFLPNYLARAKLCYTNTPPRTYVRAPGVVQSCVATGILLERVAAELGLPADYVKNKNFLQDGNTTIMGQVRLITHYYAT
jgi:xanthine dehydrogenase large subunit